MLFREYVCTRVDLAGVSWCAALFGITTAFWELYFVYAWCGVVLGQVELRGLRFIYTTSTHTSQKFQNPQKLET